jgi:GNAT superfamily N-acetyltransferase
MPACPATEVTVGMEFRDATAADGATILALIRELAEYERLAHAVTATPADIKEHLFGPRPAAFAIIAEVDGEPAGFALAFRTFSTFRGRPGLYLEDLFVRPAYRRRGIGRRFFAELARRVRDMNGARLEWAVLDWNAPALDFYQAMGAVPMNEWTTQRLEGDALSRLADSAITSAP